MGNSSTSSLPTYSCLDNLSKDSITSEYWESYSINESFEGGSIAIGIVMLVFFLIGLPSNTVVIASMIHKHLYKDPTHILLLNLGISDLLVCLLVMPPTFIAGFAGGFIFGDSDYTRCQVCKIGLIFVTLSIYSLNTLGLLSLDRYIFIKFPMHYNKVVTVRRTIIAVSVLWLVCIAESILPLFGFGEIKYTYSVSTCLPYLAGETHVTMNVYYMVFVVLLSFIPITLMFITNTWIVCIVQKQLKNIYHVRMGFSNEEDLRDYNRSLKKEIQKKKNRKQLVLIRVFGTILVANIFTWMPIIIHTFVLATYGDNLPLGLYIFVYLSVILHSVLHPLIESYFIPEIKSTFKAILGFITCKQLQIKKKEIADTTGTNACNSNLETESEDINGGIKTRAECCSLEMCNIAVLPVSNNN